MATGVLSSRNVDSRVSFETLESLLTCDYSKRIIGPIAAVNREVILYQSAPAERDCRNLCAFFPLFPSIGVVFEEQESVSRQLGVRGRQAEIITQQLRKRILPNSWSELWENVKEIANDVAEVFEQGVGVLAKNNTTLYEKGVRKPEYSALQRVLTRVNEGQDFKSLLRDGEAFFLATDDSILSHEGATLKQAKHVVVGFLMRQYDSLIDIEHSKSLQTHLELVNELPAGALFAYLEILSLVYEVPTNRKETDPPKYAANGREWLFEWNAYFVKEKFAQRLKAWLGDD